MYIYVYGMVLAADDQNTTHTSVSFISNMDFINAAFEVRINAVDLYLSIYINVYII